MKYLIAGRTGRGKDYLKGLLEHRDGKSSTKGCRHEETGRNTDTSEKDSSKKKYKTGFRNGMNIETEESASERALLAYADD